MTKTTFFFSREEIGKYKKTEQTEEKIDILLGTTWEYAMQYFSQIKGEIVRVRLEGSIHEPIGYVIEVIEKQTSPFAEKMTKLVESLQLFPTDVLDEIEKMRQGKRDVYRGLYFKT